MSTDKSVSSNSMLVELFQAGVYKPTQGKIARQVTALALAIVFVIGGWRLYTILPAGQAMRFALPVLLSLAGLWFSYRIVNYPKFADFLIAVEAEMNKVSWPSRGELIRSSMVVIFVMLGLSFVLFGFDTFWQIFFQLIGIVQISGGGE